AGTVLFAQSFSQQVTLAVGADPLLTFPFQVNRGYLATAWSLIHSDGSPASCTGVTGVELVDTNTATHDLVTDVFAWNSGHGTTYPLPLATYDVSVEALGGSPEGKIGAAALLTGNQVQFGNQVKDLGTVVITLDPGH